jgi:hypothetical protein
MGSPHTREIKNMATRMQQRRGTAAQWTAANPVLAAGEIGYEIDTEQFRIGDGTSSWSNLSPFKNIEDGGADFIELAQKGAAHGVATLNASAKIPLTQLPTELSLDLDLETAIAAEVTARNAAIELAVQTELSAHATDTTGVHGIDDTAALATKNYADNAVSDHNNDTTLIHGIADTAALETKTDSQAKADAAEAAAIAAAALDATAKANDAEDAAIAAAEIDATTKANAAQVAAEATASSALTAHNNDTTSVHGIADTSALALMTDVTDAANDAATDATTKANAAQAAAEATAATALSDHNTDSTNVHGISNTADLATKSYADTAVSTHNDDTTGVHGIADTALLATKEYADAAGASAESTASAELTTHAADTTGVHGIADTSALALTADVNSGLALKANLAGATFTGDVTVETNLTVDGNFTVTGTTTTVDATNLVVSDPMIYLGEGNTGNLVDIGFVANFNDGTYQHTGLVRDSSAGKWKLFKGVTDEPTTTVNFDQGGLDDLEVASIVTGDITLGSVTQGTVTGNDLLQLQGVTSNVQTQLDSKASTTQLEEATLATFSTKTASYTLALADQGNVVEVDSSSATTISIPLNSAVAFPIGCSIDVFQKGTGQVTIGKADASIVVYNTPGLKFRDRYSMATLTKRGTNTWIVSGDLTA